MPIFNIFSKRQKMLRGEVPDVYVYDKLPEPLRVQIIHIWRDTIVNEEQYYNAYRSYPDNARTAYTLIVECLCREYGVFRLSESKGHVGYRDRNYLHRPNASKIADEAIEELNYRFKEHGIGYQFTNGQIIRTDSELIHAEIVKPALKLLHQKHYAGAEQEFLKAHEHYRKGNAKEALSECLKAFESVMKAICDKRGWQYGSNATAKPLIQACFDNGLIPPFWESNYSSLRSLLESGVPTGRNKLSGHGQGTTPTTVSDHLVAYMLHMTASAIVFLAEADKNLR